MALGGVGIAANRPSKNGCVTLLCHDGVQLVPVMGVPSGGGMDIPEQTGMVGHREAVERIVIR